MTELTKKVLDSIVTRLTAGKSTLGQESKALGINHNAPLREALTEHVGSKEAYGALIAKAREKRSRPKATGTKTTKNKKVSPKKATGNKTPKKTKNPSPDDGSSSSDDNDDGEPQDVVSAMSGGQEEERREELEPSGVAGIDAEPAMSLV